MEDQVHKPHRKSKDRKEKKQHTGGLFPCTIRDQGAWLT
jgi:hypothetical protein